MKLSEQVGKGVSVSSSSIWLFSMALFFGVVFPLDALAATAHLEEHASKYIERTRSMYGEIVNTAALLNDVDPKLVLAVIVAESEGNTKVVSRRGAQGLMQLMPRTAREMGAKNSQEPFQNILAGTKYLKELKERYGFDSVGEVLVAYNMGPEGAKQWLLKHPPEEYGYVENVLYLYRMLDAGGKGDASLTKVTLRKLAKQDIHSGLRSLVARPRTLALTALPVMIPTIRRNGVELKN